MFNNIINNMKKITNYKGIKIYFDDNLKTKLRNDI